jgi:NAD(P)-dependent dehydrogenase (short-subunit alcohol dehydrogenase family)
VETKERVAVVTGGGRGIGQAICLALAEHGHSIVIADINLSAAEDVARQLEALGRGALPVKVDISSRPAVQEMVQAALKRFGRLDMLVNNAGICALTPFEEITDAAWARTIAVNLTGAFICSQEALKVIKPRGWGRVISISSAAGKMGSLRSSADYAASKGGLIPLTLCIARQYARYGITANVVAPGTIEGTDLNRDWPPEAMRDLLNHTPLGRLGHPRDVAAAVAFLASEEAGFITGEVMDVNGGFLMD